MKKFKAVAFDGTSDIIPKSEYYGPDTETTKSKGYWIAEWILKRKILQRKTKNPKDAAKINVNTKFNCGKFDFKPSENSQRNEIEIISVETRPGRKKSNSTV